MAATKKTTNKTTTGKYKPVVAKNDEPRLPGFFGFDDGAGIRPLPPTTPAKKPANKGKKK